MNLVNKTDILARAKEVNEWRTETQDAFVAKMERVRLAYDISAQDFARLLGLEKENAYRTLLYGKAKPTLQMFLSFCYIFGYDLADARSNAPDNKALDKAAYELASIFMSMSPDAIDELSNFISLHLTEDSSVKIRLRLALKEYSALLRAQDDGDIPPVSRSDIEDD